jgi:hypothetical protein
MGDQQSLTEAIHESATQRDGRTILPCALAFQIAGKFSVDVRVIGEICNVEGIKIAHCQLGCFK